MNRMWAVLALAVAVVPTAAVAQRGSARAAIPSQFHGKWAPNARACRGSPATENIIDISANGYSGFEESTDIRRAGQVRRGTHYFHVVNHMLPEREVPGTLALRLAGGRLALSSTTASGTVHWSMVRCR